MCINSKNAHNFKIDQSLINQQKITIDVKFINKNKF